MSYCRWSTDDFDCDLYIYSDVSGGYTTWVANNRLIVDRDKFPPPVDITEDSDAWFERHKLVAAALENAEQEPIGLPHDGECFRDDDIQTLVERLREFKTLGYRFPDSVIDELLAEAEEEANDG